LSTARRIAVAQTVADEIQPQFSTKWQMGGIRFK